MLNMTETTVIIVRSLLKIKLNKNNYLFSNPYFFPDGYNEYIMSLPRS